ncbi:MAG: type III restriction-modification system endonuclease [Streptococcaceae bacterium]|jgi:type III restriction enzyme|nr:type III restriction-modification system endonuclease [Streptococcaceae bacterium]
MKLNLEELAHQRQALDAILANFPKLNENATVDANGIAASSLYANPLLQGAGNESSFIDVKMETGTGKTYVYTRLMYELNEARGLNKFIIVVPSLAIKEGTKNFITSDYARQHFSQFFANKTLTLYQIKAGDFAKKRGRYQMSNELLAFTEAQANDRHNIHVLLMSDKGFLDAASSSLFKDHYDQGLLSSARTPAEAISMTHPVVIIDEPHRLKRDGNSYRNILKKLKAQMILRFGATFPERIEGTGRNKQTRIDYYRPTGPIFDLNAIESFNQGLVKGVEVLYPTFDDDESKKYRVKTLNNKKVVFTSDGKDYEVAIGEQLGVAFNDTNFDNDVEYDGAKKLSTGLELEVGMTLFAGTFDNSYQEILLSQMLDEHFNKEKANFSREGYPVKTISLAFIDSIKSYRDETGWLKQTFEKLLMAKLDGLIKTESGDYLDFLRASRANISATHGGYFAQDWGASDESAVAEEVDDILHKEKTLTFRNRDGSWNLRRFFFSKWTLREGWDNPNVFVIAKLRSSGSEISKLQEVGRGLRLPVDVMGNRLSNDDFYMSYIIDFSEKDFAKKLTDEVNRDYVEKVKVGEALSEEIIETLIEQGLAESKRKILNLLADDSVLDDDFKVLDSEKLMTLLPQVASSKIRLRPNAKKIDDTVKLKKENWAKVKALWLELSKRYMIHYEAKESSEWLDLFEDLLKSEDVFQLQYIESIREQLVVGGEMEVRENIAQYRPERPTGQIPYSLFVKRIASETNLPLKLIHVAITKNLPKLELSGEISDYFNNQSLSAIVRGFKQKFVEKYAQSYHFEALSFEASTSIWNKEKNDFVDSIPAGAIGVNETNETSTGRKALYDEPPVRYDSADPELDLLKQNYGQQVTTFGKLPRRAIRIPTYLGGTTTPDFVYATKDGLYLLVETKSDNKRASDETAVAVHKKFFEDLKQEKVSYIEANRVGDVLMALGKLESNKE